jgi:ribokinase
MAAHIVTVIGSINSDLVTTTPRMPSGGETLTGSSFSIGAGGKGANQAVACARLSKSRPQDGGKESRKRGDVQVKMIGAVGSDAFGPHLKKGLQDDGIDVSKIEVVDDQTTGVAVIIVEERNGENRILLNPGANHSLREKDFQDPSSFGSEKPNLIVLQLEIPLKTVLQIIQTAKAAEIAVLLNPAPAVPLPDDVFEGLDHLIVNENEAMILSGRSEEELEGDVDWAAVADEFLKKGVKHIVVTLGAKGAYAAGQDCKGFFVEVQKDIKVVDTTAAGDTFVGAYAVSVVRNVQSGWRMEEAVRWACRAAGRTVERKGAQSAIPWADEVDKVETSR